MFYSYVDGAKRVGDSIDCFLNALPPEDSL